MKLHREFSPKSLFLFVAVLLLVTSSTVSTFAQSVPAIVSTCGYINGTSLTRHTSAAFNSTGSTTLVAFVSSHPAWPWPPVRITVQGPAVVSSIGYINGNDLTSHTTAAFNSSGATTLVAFVSTNNPWKGLPVSIISPPSDNVGTPGAY